MSPRDASGGGRFRESLTPGRIAIIVVVILALVFIFQNTHHVKIRLLIPEVTMPLYLALLGVGVIGALCGVFSIRRRK